MEDFTVKVFVGFDGVHGVLVVDVGKAFAGVGFAVDGEVDLRARTGDISDAYDRNWEAVFQRGVR